MKKYILIIFSLAALLNISSCKKSELEIENPNSLTEDLFWKTEDDAQKGLNAAYAMFYKPGLWSRWIYFRLDLTSDEGYSISPWVELADWTRFQYINYNFWEGNVNTWRDTYKAIFRVNQVISNIEDIPFSDEAAKAQIIGEAKFLRALHYYYAALLWENVPLVLEPSKPEDLPAQNTLQQVFDQVEADLQSALTALPVSYDDAHRGRPTKGAVQGLLARLYMQQHKWDLAKTALDYFFTGEGSGQYELMANYQDNFSYDVENNRESVFEIQFSDANKGGDGDDPNATMSTNRPQFFAPRGIGWSDGQARYWMVDEFKKEMTTDAKIDPRLRYTLFYPALEADFGDKVYGRDWEWGDNEAWFRKYSRDYARNNEDYFAQSNFRMIRYADILLMYAEVLNELGQTTSAYEYVDQVRARAGMADLATAYPAIGGDKDAFRNRLKMERMLELCGESVRWADLKRWGDLDSQAGVDIVKQRDPDFNNFKVGKHIRLPIPQIEVENNTQLQQNPEY
ncbi:MAG TPA: RagB/SusD family nutrient uptake outer membrane protein [Flavitalea sp.]|nr:RagB/SusD family nutrient uptake outer membrane protein [Flavitalea sp.]